MANYSEFTFIEKILMLKMVKSLSQVTSLLKAVPCSSKAKTNICACIMYVFLNWLVISGRKRSNHSPVSSNHYATCCQTKQKEQILTTKNTTNQISKYLFIKMYKRSAIIAISSWVDVTVIGLLSLILFVSPTNFFLYSYISPMNLSATHLITH